MIAKLRRNFILVAMGSTIVVLTVIIGAMNFISYEKMVDRADDILELLVENDATFPEMLPPPMSEDEKGEPAKAEKPSDNQENEETVKKPQPPEAKQEHFGLKGMTVETPYETRYFSVRLWSDGELISADTGKIAAVEAKTAAAYAKEVWETGKESGFYGSYRYRLADRGDESLVVFVDRSRELASYQTQAVASVAASVLGLLAVFVLVLIFSRLVFKPVAVSYEKQKRFITDAGHELKTPLTIIAANVDVLGLEMEESTWMISIRKQIERMNHLVEQLVALSRMDESKRLQNAVSFDLEQAVRETAEFFAPLVESRGKQLKLDLRAGSYYGEERLIRQLVSLLLENAVKYSSPQGLITLSLQPKGRKYVLSVWNTVEEIPKGNLNVLFERFYRLDSSRNSETGGSGIGLSIVKSIVELHRGRITACSEDGKSLKIEMIL